MNWVAIAVLFLDLAVGVEASDNPDGPVISWPASPAQLVPGKASGTFHFTNAAYVSFSREAAFPVDLVIAGRCDRFKIDGEIG
jgi:hypothetical protein